MPPTPPKVLVRLLRFVSSRDVATATIGDILEDWHARHARSRPPKWPRIWLTCQMLLAVAAELIAAGPRARTTAGLVVRDAWRSLRVSPSQSLFVVGVLTLGITAGTITYSVVDAVMLRPLPIDTPDRIVYLNRYDTERQVRLTPEVFRQLRDGLQTVESLAIRTQRSPEPGGVNTINGRDWRPAVMQADATAFAQLRFGTAIGRVWSGEEEAEGVTDVAVLGYGYWRNHLNGDPAVLGTTAVLEGRSYRVIGVLAADTYIPEIARLHADIWVPQVLPHTGSPIFAVYARLRPGVTLADFVADIQHVTGMTDWTPTITSLLDLDLRDDVRGWLWLALGAAVLVVLIACVNAANLLLTRASTRVQEMAVRASMGASPGRIAASLLTEGLLLAGAATAAAAAMSIFGVRLARTALMALPYGFFRAETIALNGRVLVTMLAVAAVTGVLVAVVPAWYTSRTPASHLLKDAEGARNTSRRRWRSTFLVTEVAAVVVLLSMSWLFVVSLIHVINTPLGFDLTNLVAVKPNTEFRAPAAEVLERLERVPGVTDVAVSMGASLPLIGVAYGGAWWATTVTRPDGAVDATPLKVMDYRVSPNFFDVAGMPFVLGGTWSMDTIETTPSIVIDERVAARLFGGDSPLGRQLRRTDPDRVYTIVGVVPYVPVRGPESETDPVVYFPRRLNPTQPFATFFVRTSQPPDAMVHTITTALAPVSPPGDAPYVFTAGGAFGRLTAMRRFNAGLMAAFGLVGVLIGAAGVYAVMASFVAQQTREIGVRLALGATPRRIHNNVLTLAGRHLITGLLIGVPLAWWLSRGLAAMLFRVTPADASVYLGVSLLLTLIGLVAAWVPARRAATVDPIISLRG